MIPYAPRGANVCCGANLPRSLNSGEDSRLTVDAGKCVEDTAKDGNDNCDATNEITDDAQDVFEALESAEQPLQRLFRESARHHRNVT